MEKLLNMNETADILGIRKSTLYQLVMRKKIGFVKVGKLTRFTYKNLEDYINKNMTEATKTEGI